MINYKFKTTPYKHQSDALQDSWDKENFAYFMEMGTGKSKVLLVCIKTGMILKYLRTYQTIYLKKWFYGKHLINQPNKKIY